ncbi:MAG: sigma 54-interacting transcriptional regulator [Gammaproteobacteria bacterium]|nr:sigma 54-interacting transcriptional regulator [Gammaproteobacteria bacterium]
MTTQNKILLVDDDPGLLKLLAIRLESADFQIKTVESGPKALAIMATYHPDLIITDLRMDGMDGMTLFKTIHQKYPLLPVIILTAHGSIPDAVDATHQGVFSYLTKPYDSKQLMDTVSAALVHQFRPELSDQGIEDAEWHSKIVTQSTVMIELKKQAWKVAQSDVSVLIQSDSGTGKELLAHAIHKASQRQAGPFVPINCAAIPGSLLESELFGYRKGAFTGADRHHRGLFEEADGGTLFLDEIGDMPLEFQSKLLRVLQEGTIRPLGETKSISVDVRIISATHKDLDVAVEVGEFREDLFYRLNVVLLELPSLTQRSEDIPLLSNHFLSTIRSRNPNCIAKSFSPDAMEALMSAPWPGNVRQLLNVVEQVTALTTTAVISGLMIKKALRGKTRKILPLVEAQRKFECEYLIDLMQITHGNVTRAANLAHRNRTEFYKLLNRHHLQADSFRQQS